MKIPYQPIDEFMPWLRSEIECHIRNADIQDVPRLVMISVRQEIDALKAENEKLRAKLSKFADQLEERGAYLVEGGFEEPFECEMLREARAALDVTDKGTSRNIAHKDVTDRSET